MRVHERTIHGENTFKCEHCSREFNQKGNLKTHIENTHENFLHKCEYCTFQSTSKSYLKDHVRSKHCGNSVNCTSTNEGLKVKLGYFNQIFLKKV